MVSDGCLHQRDPPRLLRKEVGLLDFFQIQTKEKPRQAGKIEIYPVFRVRENSEDLMIRGGSFYAIWDEERELWSQNEYDVQRLVDIELHNEAKRRSLLPCEVKDLETSTSWKKFKEFIKNSPDSYHQLDSKLVFSNSQVRK